MDKKCHKCSYAFGKNERSSFAKAQFFEFLFCPNCQEKSYLVLEEKQRVAYNLLNILSYVLPLCIAFVGFFVILYFWFGAVTEQSFSSLRYTLITFVALGFMFVLRRKIMRYFYWKLARINNSPFV